MSLSISIHDRQRQSLKHWITVSTGAFILTVLAQLTLQKINKKCHFTGSFILNTLLREMIR
jgi:hypothetical protein